MPDSNVFCLHRIVCADDIDEMNHVNNLQYLRWTLQAASAHSRSVGWPSDRYRTLGAGWLVRSHKITYKVSAVLDDPITIRTWIEDFDRVSSLRKYEIVRSADDCLCAQAETRWVFIDYATQKLKEIPAEVRMAFLG
jgi:acyl-CoA thioester hydrolase